MADSEVVESSSAHEEVTDASAVQARTGTRRAVQHNKEISRSDRTAKLLLSILSIFTPYYSLLKTYPAYRWLWYSSVISIMGKIHIHLHVVDLFVMGLC